MEGPFVTPPLSTDHDQTPTIQDLAEWVRHTLGHGFPPDTNGVWRTGDRRPVHRLGIALAGSQDVTARARHTAVDALLLHRPWQLGELPHGVGVLAVHEALDQRLTTGENPWLARQLGFTLGEGIGQRQGQPLVCLAHSDQPSTVGELLTQLHQDFPSIEIWNPQPRSQLVQTIALANAMQPKLVASAAERGVVLYLTGTLRTAAYPTLMQTQMAALGLGHQAIEQWGLRWLSQAIQQAFSLELVWLDDSLVNP
jgi:putative NIF3 family GTP cyclohydrolase 1 type 2